MLNNVISIFESGAAAAGDYESIATVTVGSGGAANVQFTSIPSTYKHLQIRGICRGADSANNRTIVFQFNSDTNNNYTYHILQGDGSSASALAATSVDSTYTYRMPAANATSNIFGTFVVDILDYADSNKYSTIRALNGFDDNGGTYGSVIRLSSSLWLNTNAITSIKGLMNVGNITQYSHFALYGIKGA